jgi:cysteinyl-tRNA synthetase
MSTAYLGSTFDLHGGGQDLIFPHHENELAQSEGATGHAPARYWLHNAHVTVDQTKMSKSLGNFFTLKEIFTAHAPRVVRFFLISKHYRSPIDYSDDALTEAEAALNRIDEAVGRAEQAVESSVRASERCPAEFTAAMDEDFNTAGAIGVAFGLVSTLNVEIDGKRSGWKERARALAADIRKCCDVLGIPPEKAESRRIEAAADMKFDIKAVHLDALLQKSSLNEAEIENLLKARDVLRAGKEYILADKIRARLQEIGYDIRDDKGRGSRVSKRR